MAYIYKALSTETLPSDVFQNCSAFAMQSGSVSSDIRSSHHSSGHGDPPLLDVFTLTTDDINALQEYVDEFQDADAEQRSKIIANAMADIVEIRPPDDTFNKVDASKVRVMFRITSSAILIYY